MRTLVAIERQEEDTLGLGLKRRWLPTGVKAWVGVEMLSGTELTAAQQIEARASHLVTTHWQADIRPGDRLVTAGGPAAGSGPAAQTFNIVAVNNVRNLNRELQLTCTEVVAA